MESGDGDAQCSLSISGSSVGSSKSSLCLTKSKDAFEFWRGKEKTVKKENESSRKLNSPKERPSILDEIDIKDMKEDLYYLRKHVSDLLKVIPILIESSNKTLNDDFSGKSKKSDFNSVQFDPGVENCLHDVSQIKGDIILIKKNINNLTELISSNNEILKELVELNQKNNNIKLDDEIKCTKNTLSVSGYNETELFKQIITDDSSIQLVNENNFIDDSSIGPPNISHENSDFSSISSEVVKTSKSDYIDRANQQMELNGNERDFISDTGKSPRKINQSTEEEAICDSSEIDNVKSIVSKKKKGKSKKKKKKKTITLSVTPDIDKQFNSEKILVVTPQIDRICLNRGMVEKDFIKLLSIQMEFHETEKNYVRILNTLLSIYLLPLKDIVHDIPEIITIEKVYNEINSIKNYSEVLIKKIEAEFNKTETRDVPKLGSTFLLTIQFLTTCSSFISSFNNYSIILETAVSREKAQKVIKPLKTSSTLDISSYLIAPVHRLSKYTLLFKEMLKSISPTYDDYDDILKAYKMAVELGKITDECSKEVSNEHILNLIKEKLIIHEELNLVNNNRKFLFQGPLKFSDIGKPKWFFFILFNDMMLQTIPLKNKKEFKYIENMKSCNDIRELSNFHFKVKKVINFESTKIESSSNIFDLWLPNNVKYSFECYNEDEKDVWVKYISEFYKYPQKFDQLIKNERYANLAFSKSKSFYDEQPIFQKKNPKRNSVDATKIIISDKKIINTIRR